MLDHNNRLENFQNKTTLFNAKFQSSIYILPFYVYNLFLINNIVFTLIFTYSILLLSRCVFPRNSDVDIFLHTI